MSSCLVCGAVVGDSTKFCGKCGSRQEGRVGQPASEPLAQNVLPEMPFVEQPGRSLDARLDTALVTAPGQSLGASPAIQTRTPIVHTATAISPETTTHEVKAVSQVDTANEGLRPEIEVSPESGTIDPGGDTRFISSLSAPPVIYVSPQPAGSPASPSVNASVPVTPTGSSAAAPAYEDVAFQAAEPGPLPVSEPLPPLADWPTTAPFYGAPTIAKPPALSRASGSRRITIAVASLGIVALATLAYWVNHPTNREPVAEHREPVTEQARLASLATGMPPTLEEARAEVASLEGKMEGVLPPSINPKDGLEYVRIAPGSFIMGCSPGDSECADHEKPAHRVTLTKGFRMGVTAVTQEAYQRVMGTNPSTFKGAKLPVETVAWTQAQNYCSTVGMRLPTEAEWEYAARAGTTGARYGELDTIAWYDQNSGDKPHEVGQKAPNAWGLYDMLGNVWQWTGDWWADEYQGGNETDPKGPASGQSRTLRGGSWSDGALRSRASDRFRIHPDGRSNFNGFRCVGE